MVKGIDKFKVGDRVSTYELSDIYNTYILLSNTLLVEDGSTIGTIEFIGTEQNQEMIDIFNMCKNRDGKKPMIFCQSNLPDGVYSI